MSDAPDNSSSTDANAPQHRFTHHAMNCDWGILIPHEDGRAAQAAADAAFEQVDRVEQELSRFLPRSDITRLNLMPPGGAVRLGPVAWECLALAQEVWEKTAGAFDVTIGAALVRNDAQSDQPPPIGMQFLRLDRENRSATRLLDNLLVDLGAIGKGFGVDQAVETLREWGIASALVHSGQSTLFALGAPPDHSGWQVAIRDPRDHSQILGHVSLCDQAFSGSGVLLHGPHIIDPRHGLPALSTLAAWVVARSAALSDAVSTAFMVLPPDEAKTVRIAFPDVSALIALPAPSGISLNPFGAVWPDFSSK